VEISGLKAVLKIGGSLMNSPENLWTLLMTIEKLAGRHQILLVPGGGIFADNVMKIQEALALSDETAHWMAVMAQDQFGIMLSDRLTLKTIITEIDEFTKSSVPGLYLLLPYSFMKEKDELPHTWHVTSDSIALWISEKISADLLLLVKSVDGIMNISEEAQLLNRVEAKQLHTVDVRNVVDTYLPQLVPRFSGQIFIVNGNHPKRIVRIFSNQLPICTEII
jgi:aspartokinase-like uncharacterized kinase